MAYTTIDNPELYFQTDLFTGNATDNTAYTLDGSENMQPDWIWIKNRTDTEQHRLMDSVRGASKVIKSSGTGAEEDVSNHLKSFDTNGFTLGIDNAVNGNGDSMVAWCWKAGGSASSNSDGSLTVSRSVNTTAGFSILTYTGSGTAGAAGTETIAHGLGVAPKVVIIKQRNEARNWSVGHDGITWLKYLYLDVTNAAAGGSSNNFWNDSAPTSSVVTLIRDSGVNKGTGNYVAYCFAEKQGYSKFGSYTGNDNANGTFVYTGFAPAWVMIKRTNSVNDWIILDTKRNPINPSNERLLANTNGAASTANTMVDFLSNGFKPRSTYGGINGASDNFIYIAFAEAPFVNSNGVPNNAR